tara:strand:- start:161 stop:376 length:216 start_codon:yes stop_codon:yes gene_type:complete
MHGQPKHLGASCDDLQERFAMDEALSKAVLEVFVSVSDSQGRGHCQVSTASSVRALMAGKTVLPDRSIVGK